MGFQGVGEAVVRVAWGQGPIIGQDFTLVMLRGRVYSSYTLARCNQAAIQLTSLGFSFLTLLHP